MEELKIDSNNPTLDQLIEIAGDELISLEHIPDGAYDDGRKMWIANSKNHSMAGETIREAVIELLKKL